MSEYERNTIDYAKKIAISSLIMGIIIFLAFLFFSFERIAYIGVLFILLATIANGIILLQLIYLWCTKKNKKKEIRNVILLVISNIPIALILMKIGGDLFRNRFGL